MLSREVFLIIFLTLEYMDIQNAGSDPVPICRTNPCGSKQSNSCRKRLRTDTSRLCFLPPPFPEEDPGEIKLLQDCKNFKQYGLRPPKHVFGFVGVAPLICCPMHPVMVYEGEKLCMDEDTMNAVFKEEDLVPQECNFQCVNASRCQVSATTHPPSICGSDPSTGEDLLCCSQLKRIPRTAMAPKYGIHDCQDMHPRCEIIARLNPDACKPGSRYHDFMKVACMESCKICGKKGCVDEFEECEMWASIGHCATYAPFMSFHCRESCGSCGFRSGGSDMNQISHGKDYTQLTDPSFHCGESAIRPALAKRGSLDLQKLNPESVLTRSDNEDGIKCGSTYINDQFIVSAAHCMQTLEPRSIVIRDGTPFKEDIEIKRTFVHPNFILPDLYNDIAVSELGRRIIFNFTKYGDSPSCLGSSGDSYAGEEAVFQGYGGQSGVPVLTETNLTVISNKECTEYLKGNSSNNMRFQIVMNLNLRKGVTNQMLCTTGYQTDNGWTGPCPGDSGSGLYIYKLKQGVIHSTLVGIHSGGLTCSKNVPAWYTRVSTYVPWIDCIVKMALHPKKYTHGQITEYCKERFEIEN